MGMGDFWMGIAAVQNAASGTKPVDGIALALLIGGRLFIVAALNR